MRVFWGAVLAAVVACGTSTSGNGNTGQTTPPGGGTPADAGTGGVTPPQTFAVALGVTGNGEIDGLGDPCTATCIRQVQQGTIELHAVAAQGFNFDHWSTACAGNVCSVAVTSDMSVTATFVPQPVQLPPPPVLRKLTVSVTGDGRVTSTPTGIDCPGTCSMSFPDGAHVALTAAPGTGMLFSGFSGACTGAACLLTLGADANVTAAFAVDDCLGLVPAKLPPPLVPNIACNGGCNGGTSDDGTGNFMLRASWDSIGSPMLAFVSLRNGTLQPQNNWFFNSNIKLNAFSEPSGFTMIEDFSFGFFNELTVDRFGNFTNSQPLSGNGETAVLGAPDPSGGFVVLRTVPEGAGFTATTWQRFDAAGLPALTANAIASEHAATLVTAAAVTLSGSTLVETHVTLPSGAVSIERQWVRSDGIILTNPFSFSDTSLDHSYQFLLDGGLLERSGSSFTRVWKEGVATPSALPAWLASRSAGLWLAPIHEGAGYAMAGTCSGGLEVLSKAGRTCGCMPVPGLSAQTSIGRDGSLIVPRNDHYEIYPLLFHP